MSSTAHPPLRVLLPALAIAVPTLVLLVLGMQSVRRQQQAIVQLQAANLQLSAERVARVLADRVAAAAAATLRDPTWADLRQESLARDERSVVMRSIADRHGVVGDLVLVDGSAVTLPPLAAPFEDGMPAPEREVCGTGLEQAEALEYGSQPARALALYRSCLRRVTVAAGRARMLARIARVQRRVGDEAGAIDTWRTLQASHADERDRFARPFGLLAALELHDLDVPEAASLLHTAGDALLAGRWPVSDEQARYFRDELRQRIGAGWPRDEGPYFRTLELARAVQERLPLSAAGDVAREGADDVLVNDRRTRVYHGRLAGPGSLGAVIVPDRKWIEDVALSAVARDLGVSVIPRIVDAAPEGELGALASADGALAPWRVWVPATATGTSRLPLLLQATLTVLVSGVLGLGILFLVRDARRERAVARVRSQFVSAASHELRTPLAMILLYAQTLLEDVDADRDERRGSYAIIAEESERLRHLLDKVLDVSRIDAGRRQYHFEVAPLRDSVEAALALIVPQLRRRGFAITTDLADLPPVPHDQEAITGAVINLVENAAKYSGQSRAIEVRSSERGDDAVIEVRDFGIGVPADELPRLGEQFFRSRTVPGTGGHGLGLYLVKHAMSAHGGRLDVSSVPGQGSTFSLVLPRVPGTEVQA